MHLSHPAYDLLGEASARVLGRLAVLAEGASGRRIHELSGVPNLRTTQRILAKLVGIGLADVQAVGSANLYTLNRAHTLWPPIEVLLEMPAALESELSELVIGVFGDHIRHAILYGSFARGAADAASDIDVLLVWRSDGTSPDDRAVMVEGAVARVRSRTGNGAQFLAVTDEELNALVTAHDPLIDSLRSEGRPLTAETNVARLLKGDR